MPSDYDVALELARLAREAEEKVKERMQSEQMGELFYAQAND